MYTQFSQNAFLFYIVIFGTSIISSAFGISGAILIPLAALRFGAKESIGIITIYFLFQNISKLILFKGKTDFDIAKNIIIWSIPGVIIGSQLLIFIPEKFFQKILAISIIIFIVQDIHCFIKKKQSKRSLPFFGFIYGFFSGLLGSGNIVKGPMLLSMGLLKESYIATSALTAFAVNIPKIGIYTLNGIINFHILLLSAPFVLLSFLGTFIGKKILKKISHNFFYYVITVFFLITAFLLLFE